MSTPERHRFELVSFDLCPYVQRSVITLLHKKVDFKLTYIDLWNPPEWFNRISPLGKVPVLLVRESERSEPVAIFESAVINEFVDEVTPPTLMPGDPLSKAFERAWIAVGAELFTQSYPMMASQDVGEVIEAQKEIFETLQSVERVLGDGPYFTGPSFSLVDAAFAPFFMRMDLFRPMVESAEWKKLPKVRRWADALAKLPEIQKSVIPEFRQKLTSFLRDNGSAWADQIQSTTH